MAYEIIPATVGNFAGANQTTKTVAFTGAANLGAVGNVPLFTVTGSVIVRAIVGIVSVTLNSTGAATLALGTTNQTARFIAATTATNMTSTNSIWATTTPTQGSIALAAADINIIVTENIVGTVATAAVSTGTLAVTCIYDVLNSGSVV